jgi:hypothetical protein
MHYSNENLKDHPMLVCMDIRNQWLSRAKICLPMQNFVNPKHSKLLTIVIAIMHFSDVTLLFEQWIIFKNLQFILLFLSIWTLTFYCFRLKNVIYIFWDFRVIVDIFFNKAYYQKSYILIIESSSVITVAEWLDGSF